MKIDYTVIFKFSLVIFLLANWNCLSAQNNQYELLKIGNKYIFDGKEYECEELGDVYKDHEEPLYLYHKGRNNDKSSKTIALGGLVSLGIGAGLILSSDNLFDDNFEAGVYFFMAGLLAEALALAVKVVGNKNLKNARKLFNLEMQLRHGYFSRSYLQFGSTRNGIGLILRFG